MLHIRPAAAQELKRLLVKHSTFRDHHPPQVYLTLQPGGCADWTYCLAPTHDTDNPVTTVNCGDISLAVPTAQFDLVKDLTIDYAEDLMGGGFRFTNPLAQQTCGCGNAFSLSTNSPTTQDCRPFSPPQS
ncbi:MAG TPA: iron-sulfur cluster assembly accessory protein [Nodosilinea sp.]|nr:iron-sulfur cluster assembly accessory protein [Nodosilinea sp.]